MALMQAREQSRRHIYELDPIRGLTAVGVVGVHIAAFTIFLLHSPFDVEVQNAVVSALHFTREIFISITAFLMVYVYGGRPFPVKKFWRKRGIGVFVPYALWSIVYTWINNPHTPWYGWVGALIYNILLGNASFQLYYILLTLELYLALPWILPWLQRLGRHPWRLLVGSGLLQLVMLALDYHLLEAGPFSLTTLGHDYLNFQDRFLPFYQFYLVLGGLGAMYRTQVQAWVLRHGKLVVAGFLLGLTLLWGELVWQVNFQHQSADYGSSVFQPVMVFYAIGVSAFAYWLASRWAVRGRKPQSANGRTDKPWGYRFWHLLSDASFGVYLMHPLLMVPLLTNLAPALPAAWPEPFRVLLLWVLSAGGTVAISCALLVTPGLSRLVGHPCVVNWSEVAWVRSRARQAREFATSLSIALQGEPRVRHAAARSSLADLVGTHEDISVATQGEGSAGTEVTTR